MLSGTNEWRGVSSDGVTSNYGAEASAVNDDSPTLAQPAIKAERWTSFVPFSFEIGQDFASLQSEVVRLMRDQKDVLDATKLLTGTGTNEPAGVLTGLSGSQEVQTATVADSGRE